MFGIYENKFVPLNYWLSIGSVLYNIITSFLVFLKFFVLYLLGVRSNEEFVTNFISNLSNYSYTFSRIFILNFEPYNTGFLNELDIFQHLRIKNVSNLLTLLLKSSTNGDLIWRCSRIQESFHLAFFLVKLLVDNKIV